MLKTHIALTALIVILFLPHISDPVLFSFVAIMATILPDVDNAFSSAGTSIFARILQFFVRHRGIVHSLTLCILLSVILTFVWPVVSLPFFLGFSFHIFLDSFTKEGVTPFWPYRKMSSWHFKTGGRMETSLFVILVLVDLIALVMYFQRLV